MEPSHLSNYFRRIRMIYCLEQQLICLLPDLVSEAVDLELQEAIRAHHSAALMRRYVMSDLAWDHGISPSGDECLAMKKLIAVGSARLAAEKRGERHDPAVESFCDQVHRVVMVDYRLTRDLAVEHGLHADIRCFDDVIESLGDVFPEPRRQSRPVAKPSSSRGAPAHARVPR